MSKKNWEAQASEETNWWWIISDSETGELGSGDGGFEEDQAKLMAAAPDLLESTQNLLSVINSIGGDNLSKEDQEKVEAAQAAINKATHREKAEQE